MKLPDTEAAEPDEVGVIRPPPTAELKPIRDGLPLPGARELWFATTAARDNCTSEEPLRFKFCNEPIPENNQKLLKYCISKIQKFQNGQFWLLTADIGDMCMKLNFMNTHRVIQNSLEPYRSSKSSQKPSKSADMAQTGYAIEKVTQTVNFDCWQLIFGICVWN